jgi:hypothetical protein
MYSRERSHNPSHTILRDEQQPLLPLRASLLASRSSPAANVSTQRAEAHLPAATPDTLKYVDLFAYLKVPFFDLPTGHASVDNISKRAVRDNLGSEADIVHGGLFK